MHKLLAQKVCFSKYFFLQKYVYHMFLITISPIYSTNKYYSVFYDTVLITCSK